MALRATRLLRSVSKDLLGRPLIGCGSSQGPIAERNAREKSMLRTNLSETGPAVISLHRDFMRSIAWTRRAYAITMTEKEMQTHITKAFRDKAHLKDVAQINKMISYGRMELEECLMLWKGESHVANWFDAARAATKPAANPPFMEKFLHNRPI